MWHELNMEQLEKESYGYVPIPPLSPEERADIIEVIFHSLYNAGKRHSPKNILSWFKERGLKPYPSASEIQAVLIEREALFENNAKGRNGIKSALLYKKPSRSHG